MEQEISVKASKIKMFITDVDGTLTDGRIIIGENGEEYKAFDSQDGQGIVLARTAGIECVIITGRRSNVVSIRASELGIKEVHQGVRDKLVVYEKLLKKYNLNEEEVAYIGDDISDLPLLKRAGLAFAVANAVTEVKDTADYITRREGGRGAVREAINLLLNKND